MGGNYRLFVFAKITAKISIIQHEYLPKALVLTKVARIILNLPNVLYSIQKVTIISQI